MTPHYWNDAKKHLSAACPVMKTIIASYHGEEGLRAREDGFYTLIRAIAGQQISVKAADAVWAKLEKAVNPLTPENLLRKREPTLRKCGFSGQKVAYARNVARFWVERGIHGNTPSVCHPGVGRDPYQTTRQYVGMDPGLRRGDALIGNAYWSHLSDEEVIAQLTSIKGIGTWTAEMFLIFHLLRPDVLPLKDLGLLKAIDLHYTGGQRLTVKEYQALSAAWEPYRTVATWYLWRALDPVPVAY